MTTRFFSLLLAVLLAHGVAEAQEARGASPKNSAVEFKIGGYRPAVGAGLEVDPYVESFGDFDMLLAKLEYDRQFFQAFGSAGIGMSAGYAEKFGRAQTLEASGGDAALADSPEVTGLRIVPFELLGVYRFDWLALHTGVPLVPCGKIGFVYSLWWSIEGDAVEVVDGQRASGGRLGYQFVGGVALMLDVLQPRFARDFDTDLGVNHSYLFAEYVDAHVDGFGSSGISLSDSYWMFGLTLEY